jgi:hypothetical protein
MNDVRRSAKDPSEIAEPISYLIRSYLRFEVAGAIAAPSLAATLMNIAKYLSRVRAIFAPQLGNDIRLILIAMRERLADQVSELLDDRSGKSVGCFDQMNYLAALYTEAAMLLSEQTRGLPGITAEQAHLLEKSDQNLDEILAHNIGPFFCAFSLPTLQRMLCMPRELLDTMDEIVGPARGPKIDVVAEAVEKYTPVELSLVEEVFIAQKQVRMLGIEDRIY